MILVGVLNMHLAFFVCLLMAGAGIRRAFEVVLRGALAGIAIGLLMAAIPYFYSTSVARVVFAHFAVLGSFAGLAAQSLRRAREFLVAKSSTFEVVCLNALVVAFGAPPDTVAFFEGFFEFAYILLVNPLGFWIPED